jgi:hypothetical protein
LQGRAEFTGFCVGVVEMSDEADPLVRASTPFPDQVASRRQ